MGTGTAASALAVRGKPGLARGHGAILVVDDDEPIRNWFLELFRREGVPIWAAASGQEAVAMVKQFPPALLIVDISLPDRDGITVLEEVLAVDNRIIGVAMTGAPSVEMAVRALKAGASDFLIKPIRNDAVLTTAHRLLDLYRLRGERNVIKHTVVQSGAVRLASLPFQTFGEEEAPVEDEGPKEFERGVVEGERRAEERCRREYAVVADIVRKFEALQASLRHTVEEEVVALAFHIASKVLHEMADTSKDLIVAQAKVALAAVREPGTVVIEVNQDDVPALEAAHADLLAQRDMALTLKFEAAPTIPRGSCLVHTHNRLIDASLDMQLIRLGQALKNRGGDES